MQELAWLIPMYGSALAFHEPARAFSRGEQVVYEELDRRIGRANYVPHWRPGDIPWTPGFEQREVDVLIPVAKLCIFVNSAFTHPDPQADQYVAWLMSLYGLESEFVWDYEILPEMGGNVVRRLSQISALVGFGESEGHLRPPANRKRFGHPPRILPFAG